jgi:hypothetical protein
MPIIIKPKDKDFLKSLVSEINHLSLYTKKLDRNHVRNKSENISIEYNLTDILQRIVDYCNSYYTSFQFELKMV